MALLTLRNVTHQYGNHTALQGINLELAPGAIGLLGPNGAGKSTLLKILMGLLKPTAGEGTLLEMSLRGSAYARRRRLGYMPEAEALVPGLKGAEYVALAGELCGMPKKEASRRAHELLSFLGLDDARYRRLEEYSTGMKQRIKLAQALVHDPPLLLLDEPTSGLDPAGREAMLSLLASMAKQHGKSFLLCTHVLSDVERTCDTTVILHQGRILCHERTEALREERKNRFRLGVEGNRPRLYEVLVAADVEVNAGQEDEWTVRLPYGMKTHELFQLATGVGALVTTVRTDGKHLEQLLHLLQTQRIGARV